jgi:Domain of unknown function (DUF4124)
MPEMSFDVKTSRVVYGMGLPRLALFLALMLALVPALAWAQVYRWVDEAGGVHYAGSLDLIPEPYRASAAPVGMPAAKSSGASTSAPAPRQSAPALQWVPPPSGPLPSQTRMPPPAPAGFWEIAHPQGLRLQFTDHAKCQAEAEKISEVFKRTVYCYARSD